MRNTSILGLSLILLVLVAACGDDDGGGAADAAQPGADAAPSPDGGGSIDAATPPGPDATPALTDLQRLEMLVVALPLAPDDAARRGLVDNFVAAVAYGERGFPIREDGMLAVVSLDTGGGTLTVTGDFNAWNPTALPLSQPSPGYPFFYRIEPVTEPLPVRTLYKLVRNGVDYFADPLARRYGYDGFGQYSLAEAGDVVSHLERWPRFPTAPITLEPRDVTVYVPAGYQASAASLPVLYMHDGQNLFDPDSFWGGWQAGDAADDAVATGAAQPFLIVSLPNTAARMDEYTHVSDDIGSIVGGRADEYVAWIADGVKPFVDARYRTLPGPASTGILGSSLGGLVSLHAGWARPDVFGHAGSMSGTLGWGRIGNLGNPTLMERYTTTAPVGLDVYIDSGGDDGGGAGCLDTDFDGVSDDTPGASDNYCENLDMISALTSLGWIEGIDLVTAWSPGAQHNEAAWAGRLPAALAGWFPGP